MTSRMLAAFTLLMAATVPASAASVAKTYAYFSIGGTTLEDIERELSVRGPQVNSTGKRHPGATQMEFTNRIGYAKSERGCSIAKAGVTVKAKVILPRWRQRSRADADTRLIWDTLEADIRRHEESHINIARNHARDLEEALMKIGRKRTCEAAQDAVKQATARVLARHDRAQEEFDRIESANFENRIVRLLKRRLERMAD